MRKIRKRKQREYRLWWIAILTVLVFCMLIWESDREQKKAVVQSVTKINASSASPKQDRGKEKKQENNKKIKVLIKTDGFASLFHKKFVVTSEEDYVVAIDGKKTTYPAGKKVAFRWEDKKWKGKKIVISPGTGKQLQMLSIKRQDRNPKYRNQIRLTWKKQGFLVCNILPLEEYLYAVVPSELSTGNKMEALKAQAVCARSYAYNQMKSQRYTRYHAHVDDSVDFQVYNNIPEDRRSRKAVNDTRGMVLTKDEKVVQTYYYSTSWGYTADGQDVWNTANEISYLQSKFQITSESQKKTGKTEKKLSGEEEFLYFLNHPECDTYDSKAEWYRWRVIIGQKSLSARIDGLLAACYRENPNLVLTQTKSGRYVKKPVKTMGLVKKIRVEHREESGLVTQIVIVGSKNVVKVLTQYNIRKVLAPVSEDITYHQEKNHTRMQMLPSAAFCIGTVTEGDDVSFLFTGGGLGHGAGLSQCGAARMAKLGKTYEEILLHYFTGTQLLSMNDLEK